MSSMAWVPTAYDSTALLGAALAIYVMQKTEHDRINRVDPLPLRWMRRLAFIIVALALCYSVFDQSWEPSLPVLGLVVAGVGNLAVNAMALHLRSPPTSQIGLRNRSRVVQSSRLATVLRRMHL